jgi:hypothetical protein
VFVSKFAAKRTLKVCKSFKFVKQVVLLDGETIGNAISLKDFKKKYEKSKLDVEEKVNQKVDIKSQVALIVCSSGTTG